MDVLKSPGREALLCRKYFFFRVTENGRNFKLYSKTKGYTKKEQSFKQKRMRDPPLVSGC